MMMTSKLKLRRATTVAAFVIAVVLATASFAPTQSGNLQRAPLNAAFVAYMNQGGQPLVTGDGHYLGAIPSPLDLSHLKGQQVFSPRAVTLPPSYDLRTLGRVTSVKNQLSCGSCWAFAAMGSLESILLPGGTWDFSENNLKNLHGFDWSPCAGGNGEIATAYFGRWSGPVDEALDPYQPTDINTSPPGLSPVKHIQNAIYIPPRASPTDNDTIKQAVMTYGGVEVYLYYNSSYYNSSNYAYYDPNPDAINHAVLVVGWDDTFDKSKFNTAPPANGAFIIKNSWGSSWGQNGYFYASYYDGSLATGNPSFVFPGPETPSNYGRVYQYDPLGWVDSWGYGTDTAWFSNVFTAFATENLTAASFYVASANSPYTVSVYKAVSTNPGTGTLAGSTSGTAASPGYLTVPFGSPVSVTSGSKFAVVVKLQTPGYVFPIPAEEKIPGYTSAASASPGQSYVSGDGTSWEDITSYEATANVDVKAFTAWAPPAGAALNITMNASSYSNGQTVTATEFRLVNPGPATPAEVKVWFDVPGLAPISLFNLGADGSFVVPAGFNHDFGPMNLFVVVAALPRGNYGFNSRLINPTTAALISEDLNPFTIQ